MKLKQQGTSHSSRDLLKICVKMGASWSAQTFRQTGEIPSGPEGFLGFCFLKIRFTYSTHTLSTGKIVCVGGGGGVGEFEKCRSERVLGVSLDFSNRQ